MTSTTTDLIAPSAWNHDELLTSAASRAIRYVREIGKRRTFPLPAEIAGLEQLGGPLPEQPSNPGDVLALMDRIGSAGTVACTGGRYFGFVTGGA